MGLRETGPRWFCWKLLMGSGRVVGNSENGFPHGAASGFVGGDMTDLAAPAGRGNALASSRRGMSPVQA